MILTKPNASVPTASKRVQTGTAFIIGMGDGRATRLIDARKLGFTRLITVALPGEELIPDLPGYVFRVDGPTSPSDLVNWAFYEHREMMSILDCAFFDGHPISVAEQVRADFCRDFYRILGDKPLDFGDDIMDGMQGAYHVALNATRLLRSPTPCDLPRLTVPAIAIGAGPSLSRHIPAIRSLQDRCVIIACDSLLDGLIAQGIMPHLVTPVERIPEIVDAFSHDRYEHTIYCGKPVVHHEVVAKFTRHLFTPCTDTIFAWCGGRKSEMRFYGQSTGVMGVAIAAQLTSGPIYLAGHDLAMEGDKSHWTGAKAAQVHGKDTFPTQGYSGEVRTDWWWDVFRRQIESMARQHGNVVNLNALDGVGAVICHTRSGSLPKRDDLPLFTFPELPKVGDERLDLFRSRVKHLPADARSMISKLSAPKLGEHHLALGYLCPSDNHYFFSYVLRSIFAQFSYENFANKAPQAVIDGMAEAMRNVVSQLIPMMEDMAHAVD